MTWKEKRIEYAFLSLGAHHQFDCHHILWWPGKWKEQLTLFSDHESEPPKAAARSMMTCNHSTGACDYTIGWNWRVYAGLSQALATQATQKQCIWMLLWQATLMVYIVAWWRCTVSSCTEAVSSLSVHGFRQNMRCLVRNSWNNNCNQQRADSEGKQIIHRAHAWGWHKGQAQILQGQIKRASTNMQRHAGWAAVTVKEPTKPFLKGNCKEQAHTFTGQRLSWKANSEGEHKHPKGKG